MKLRGMGRAVGLIVSSVIALSLAGCKDAQMNGTSEPGEATNEKRRGNATELEVRSPFAVRPEFTVGDELVAAGTAFAIRWEGEKRPILLTALHLFGPAGGLNTEVAAMELPKVVKQVTLRDLETDDVVATAGPVLAFAGAYPRREDDGSGDVAGFWLPEDTPLVRLPLATQTPSVGQVVWMVGQAGDTPNIPQMRYRARVIKVSTGGIYYEFDQPLELRATSGAPVINAANEVVALQLGGGELDGTSFGFGNAATNLRTHLKSAIGGTRRRQVTPSN